jgi:hypothetical protein
VPGPPAERRDVGLGLLGREADHVDDGVEVPRRRIAQDVRVVPVADDLFDAAVAAGDRVLALPAVEHRDLGPAGQKVLDDPDADQPRPTDDEHAHGHQNVRRV